MVVVKSFEGSSGGVAHMVLVVSAHLLEKMAQMLLSVLLRYCEVEQNLVVEVDIG
jgi:septum formation topological specificity factor MinE